MSDGRVDNVVVAFPSAAKAERLDRLRSLIREFLEVVEKVRSEAGASIALVVAHDDGVGTAWTLDDVGANYDLWRMLGAIEHLKLRMHEEES